jgi:hypothetical protein
MSLSSAAAKASALKLMSFNTYLISKPFNHNRETYPELRATKIRDRLLTPKGHPEDTRNHQNHLIFCQEVWGSGLAELTDNIRYTLPPHRTPWNIFSSIPSLSEVVNTWYLRWMRTGGLYDFASPELTCRYRSKHTFTKSRTKSLKGVEATLWDVPQWGVDKRLLVFNTHLDPWHVDNRRFQVQEIVKFVGETIEAIDKNDDTILPKDFNWTNTAVVILGDFNIKADTAEYQDTLMSNPGWIDYFQGELRHTYANENSLARSPKDYGRIDYIFGLQSYGTTHRFLPLKVVHRAIRKEAPGDESSDHYALEIELVPV